ncbi:MAG TPA: hypothetical protein VLC71_00700 [Thermomonas sp.]|nr:hypothetical protein [Thermomonas sp.]
MPRLMLLPAVIALSLAACSPTPVPASPAPAPAPSPATPVAVAAPTAPSASTHGATPADPVAAASSAAAITGAIRDGNRPPPALRVCARPIDGGTSTCIDTAAGASSYRIEVVAGRYLVSGQALDDPAMKFAHAERVRCIRAPCPPDTAIVVEVGAGESRSGIDLSAGEALPPG